MTMLLKQTYSVAVDIICFGIFQPLPMAWWCTDRVYRALCDHRTVAIRDARFFLIKNTVLLSRSYSQNSKTFRLESNFWEFFKFSSIFNGAIIEYKASLLHALYTYIHWSLKLFKKKLRFVQTNSPARRDCQGSFKGIIARTL